MSTVTRSWGEWLSVVLTLYSSVTFVLLWGGLVIAWLAGRGWLDRLWLWVRDLPVAAEVMVWVLFLPITVTLWVWQSSWPLPIRMVGFGGMVAWTLLALSSLWKLMRC